MTTKYLYYISPCSNLDVGIPEVGGYAILSHMIPLSLDDLIVRYCLFWNWEYVEMQDKKESITDMVEKTPFDKLTKLGEWSTNNNCCYVFIYKTDREPPYVFSRDDILLLFPDE